MLRPFSTWVHIFAFWLWAKETYMIVKCFFNFFIHDQKSPAAWKKKLSVDFCCSFNWNSSPSPRICVMLTSRSDQLRPFCISDAHIKGEAKILLSSQGQAPALALNRVPLDSRNTLINVHLARLGWCNTHVKWVFRLMDCLIMSKCWSKFGVIMVTIVTVHHKLVYSKPQWALKPVGKQSAVNHTGGEC